MQARDIMTAPVVTVAPDTTVQEIARLLLERRISAVPVVQADGRLAGIVSEGDLMRRPDSGGERTSSWWLSLLSAPEDRAHDYRKAHGRRAADVMTPRVVTAEESTSIGEVATLLEKHRIKRVPVVREGRVVGIVSRANLLHGLASHAPAAPAPASNDELRRRVRRELEKAGVDPVFVNVVVYDGVVRLWGALWSEEQLAAARAAARNAAGRVPVEDHLSVLQGMPRAAMWGE